MYYYEQCRSQGGGGRWVGGLGGTHEDNEDEDVLKIYLNFNKEK